MRFRARRAGPFARAFPWHNHDTVSAQRAAEDELEQLVEEDPSLADAVVEIEVEGFGLYEVTSCDIRIYRAERKRLARASGGR